MATANGMRILQTPLVDPLLITLIIGYTGCLMTVLSRVLFLCLFLNSSHLCQM